MADTPIAHLSDRELIDRVTRVASRARSAVVELLQLLGEVDARRLYLSEGCSSLFGYCERVLCFSEHEAYHRIEAARAARQFPILLDRLRDGSLTITSVTLLRPHLTSANADTLIAAASGKSKREVEHQMASLAPKADARPVVRRLPRAAPSSVSPDACIEPRAVLEPNKFGSTPESRPSSPRPISKPLSSDRYLLRVTLSTDAHDKLRRAQDLLRHTTTSGDPAPIIERALTLLVETLESEKVAAVKRPRTGRSTHEGALVTSRYISAAVRRAVWTRDAGRCAFVGRRGRCQETGQLEFHHVEAFALGGPSTAENLELRCRAHNQYESRLVFGNDSGGRLEGPTRPGPS